MADEREKTIRIYRDSRGRCPYLDWFVALRDNRAKQKIQARLARVRLGNLGHTNSVGEGVHELKIDFGPGYRVYFGQEGKAFVILLCGGDKGSQAVDIAKAKAYWRDYREEGEHADA
jgi:putative addiction module killer protein